MLVVLAVLAGCGASSGVTVDCHGAKPGSVYAEPILVERADNPSRVEPYLLYVACKTDDEAAIVDSHGKRYRDFDDFRANNSDFTAKDQLSVARRMPSRGQHTGTVNLSGHTSPPVNWWLVGGGVIALLAIGAFAYWRIFRRPTGPPVY